MYLEEEIPVDAKMEECTSVEDCCSSSFFSLLLFCLSCNKLFIPLVGLEKIKRERIIEIER